MRWSSVRIRARVAVGAAAVLVPAAVLSSQPVAAAANTVFTRNIAASGTANFAPPVQGSDAFQFPELRSSTSDPAAAPFTGQINDRRQSGGGESGDQCDHQGTGGGDNQCGQNGPTARLATSFNGINHRDQRLANGGNQFSVEPPDQGLCVGNGFVLESVNDALAVYSTTGGVRKGVTDLNTFYGYPATINRTTGVRGPFVTDPSCLFDSQTQRWFQVVLTLEVFPKGGFTGVNHLDLAVSKTSDPTGAWTIYRIDTTDDGTNGTPNHGCSPGPASPPPTHPTACLGDYPHIGADRNGFYITTNEYPFFPPTGFKSANIYALSKRALAAGSATLKVTQLDTVGAVHVNGKANPGFTVWPATSPGTNFSDRAHGTEYFMSSDAADEANGTHRSTDLIVWALTNTASLDTGTPNPRLTNVVKQVKPYALPPASNQKPGPTPLADCINDTTTPVAPGVIGCWKLLFNTEPAHNAKEFALDSNDTRMQQVMYADGLLWGALDTALTLRGANQAGIEWFVVSPQDDDNGNQGSGADDGNGLQAEVINNGYLGLAGNNVTYPAVGVNAQGKGVMAFTLVGKDHYPSAAFAAINQNGVGQIKVAAEGLGPEDGFSGYAAFNNPPRPRWGDYGAAVPVGGNTIWIASEFIGQTCTFQQYITPPFGSCNKTRTALANWYTRISRVTV